MKKGMRILLLLLCLGLAETTALTVASPIVAEAAAKKQGLKKEKGKYYYYSNGKKIKNKLKTVTVKENGKKVKYSYYFGSTGAAVTGKKSAGVLVPKLQKIKGKYYAFDNKGRMVKGLYVINDKFYLFRASDGVYKSAKSKELNNAAKEGKKSKTLLALLRKQLGKPLSRENFEDSCYGDGKDSIVYYSNFMVQLFTDKKGTEKVVCVIATPQKTQETPEQSTVAETPETSAETEPETDAPATNTTQTKKGLVLKNGSYYYYKNGKKLKNTWKTVKGYRYYFGKDGKAQTYSAKIDGKLYVFDKKGRLQKGKKNRIVTIGSRRYYVNASGQAYTGWQVVGGKLYYAAPKTGLLYQSRTYAGIQFSNTGAAKSTTNANLKIKTMSILSSITNSKMSKSQKLNACWNYMVSKSRFSYGSRYPNLNASGWQREMALHMLTYRWGNCYSFACAFAALAKEIGYSPYVICGRVSGSRDGAADGMTRHAWVQINGGYYDPEAQYAGWYTGVYGAGSYGVAHQIQKRVAF